MKIIDQIKKDARGLLFGAHGSHDWDHVERVRNLALHIGRCEGVDLEIVELAASLHDIGREEETKSKGQICHAEHGAKIAREVMKKYDIPSDKIEAVAHCIESHRLSRGKKPEIIEAKVLFDADTLDSIGAIGLGRLFFFASVIGARVHNNKIEAGGDWEYSREDTAYKYFLEKQKDVPGRMLTKEGKKIAKERHQFMVDFFDRANKEMEGFM